MTFLQHVCRCLHILFFLVLHEGNIIMSNIYSSFCVWMCIYCKDSERFKVTLKLRQAMTIYLHLQTVNFPLMGSLDLKIAAIFEKLSSLYHFIYPHNILQNVSYSFCLDSFFLYLLINTDQTNSSIVLF